MMPKYISSLIASTALALSLTSLVYAQEESKPTRFWRPPQEEEVQPPKLECVPRWFYQKPDKEIAGPYYGCTKKWSTDGTPWCATRTVMVQSQGYILTKNGVHGELKPIEFSSYIAEGKQDTMKRECTEEEYWQDYLLGPLPKLKEKLPPSQGCPPLDIMLLIDNTESMKDEIDQAKKIAQDVLAMISKLYPGSRYSVATVADAPQPHYYHNYNDIPYQRFSNFTTNIKVSQRAINNIGLMDGGDEPEAYPHALRYASNEAWNPLATRLVILIADSYARKDDLLERSISQSNFKLITLVAKEKLLNYWSQYSETLPLSDVDNLEGLLLRSVMDGCDDYPNIYFKTNNWALTKKDKLKLDQLAKLIRARNEQYDLGIFVDGHADERGPDEYNDKLGLKRAQAICSSLEQKGILCFPDSYGENQPFCQSPTPECYQQNRRGHLYPVDLNSLRIQEMIDPKILKEKILPHLKKRDQEEVNDIG